MYKPNQKIDTVKALADLVLWDKVASLTKTKNLVEKYSQIPEKTYLFALKKSNRKMVVASALKSLKKTDPNATNEQAEALADMMHIFAKMLVSEVEALRASKKTV
jgi:hypothetical protein